MKLPVPWSELPLWIKASTVFAVWLLQVVIVRAL